MDKCISCRYINNVVEEEGVCYRYPPNVVIQHNLFKSSYPTVSVNSYCGEYDEYVEQK